MNPVLKFENEVKNNIHEMGSDKDLQAFSRIWSRETNRYNYTYNFSWLGLPIIQYPQDMVAVQELIWQVKPDLVIETGIAHGGSLILSSSVLAMIDMSEAISEGRSFDPRISRRKVLGIDIDIRAHNRSRIEKHPMASRIQMIQGSSIEASVVDQVRAIAKDYRNILIFLDSNHTHDHVLAELEAYAPLTSVGGYCVVFDTLIEDMPAAMFANRPWGPGNNPKTAVWQFLKSNPDFRIDTDIQNKLQITVAPDGYLKRI